MASRRIRVGLFCRVLPHYRLPVYERLAKADDIDLVVYYSREPPHYSLKTVHPGNRFPHCCIEMKARFFVGQEMLFQPDLRRIVRRAKHDVIIFSGNPRLVSNFPAMLAARKMGVGVVWWTMGRGRRLSPITMAVHIWLTRFPDAVVVYTHTEREHLVSRGVAAEKVFVAQNAIDVSPERQAASVWDQDSLREFARKRGLEGKKLFLFCGQLRAGKKADHLLRALQVLLGQGVSCHLAVVGGGEHEEELRRLAGELGVEDSISWLGPLFKPEELAPWFLSSRALVVPRAIGLAVFHAYAYGLPVITSNDRRYQTTEVAGIEDGRDCLLFRDGDIGHLASSMRSVVEDDALRARLSANAAHKVERVYTVDTMVSGFTEAIRFALDRSEGSRRQRQVVLS